MKTQNYKKGFEILEEFFDELPEDSKIEIDTRLKECGL
uniref:ORF33 n=1 Tax=Nitrosopumilaceae spindle-shaped virus TaxID=3065433 RepID=A0AAT9J736_9VIRU|tara:strand:+ start:1494 stop:1607 length:114 start_codon:yes stop_codon:yes gene_type:complete